MRLRILFVENDPATAELLIPVWSAGGIRLPWRVRRAKR